MFIELVIVSFISIVIGFFLGIKYAVKKINDAIDAQNQFIDEVHNTLRKAAQEAKDREE